MSLNCKCEGGRSRWITVYTLHVQFTLITPAVSHLAFSGGAPGIKSTEDGAKDGELRFENPAAVTLFEAEDTKKDLGSLFEAEGTKSSAERE